MTFNKVMEVFKANNIPNDARLMSNSGWECDATDMDGIYYNQDTNTIIFTQGGKYERDCGYSGYKLLYKSEEE